VDAGQASTFIGGAFLIFPAEMHEVHTRTRFRSPSSVMIFADWRFGSQRRRVLLLALLRVLPTPGFFPQT